MKIPFSSTIYRLLRKSERYAKTDMVYLTKGGFWLNGSQVFSSLCALALSLAFARLASKESYGLYKYVLSGIGLLAITTLPGMNTAILQAVSRGIDGSYTTALRLKMKWGLIGSILSLGIAGYYFMHGQTTFAACFLIGALFLPLNDPFAMYQSYLQGKRLFSVSASSFMASQLVALIALGTTLLLTANTIVLVLVYFLAWTASNFYFYQRSLHRYTPNTQTDPSTLRYGRHLTSMDILSAVAGQLDKLLAFQLLGPAQLAIYAFAVAIPDQLKGPIKSLNSLAMPKFADQTDAQTRVSIRNKLPLLMSGSALITITYILSAPFIYRILFPQYTESIFYSQLFGISLLNSGLFPLGTYLSAKALVKDQYILNISGALFQIISMTLLTLWYGLLGLILARVITRFFGSLVNYILYARKQHTEAIA